jgi:hypothetical protein
MPISSEVVVLMVEGLNRNNSEKYRFLEECLGSRLDVIIGEEVADG